MTIPSVIQGLVETEDGKVFELETPRGSAWMESIGSFRFEPSGDSKPTQFARNRASTGTVAERLRGRFVKNILASPWKSPWLSLRRLQKL